MTDAKLLLPDFEERFLESKAVRLRYFVAGEGSPLTLIHGLGGAASNWTELAPDLARTHRVIIPELPGHGGSSPLPAAAGLQPYADRIGAVVERENGFPGPVAGHSLGGLVALRLAIRRPADVTGIVLAAAAGISSTTRRARYSLKIIGIVQPGRRLAGARRRIAYSPFLRSLVFSYLSVADPLALSPRAVQGFLAGPPLHTDAVGAAAALVLDDVRTDLGRVACPCLVVWGAEDRQLYLEDAFEFARRLRAPLRVIPDCGHLLIGERPDACLEAIESFLARAV